MTIQRTSTRTGPHARPLLLRPWHDAVVAPLLAIAAFAAAWPLRARVPVSWDAALLALGVRDYDFYEGQPHPPGYPLYVGLGKLVDLFVHDPAASLVLVSLASLGACAALAYLLARRWLGRIAATATALGVVASPLLLGNGIVGLSYVPEAAMGLLAALVIWDAALHRTPVRLAFAGGLLALSVGIRPSSAFILAGLWVWLLVRLRGPDFGGASSIAFASGLVTFVTWFIPSIFAGGGLRAFARTNSFQSQNYIFADTVWKDGLGAFFAHLGVMLGHLLDLWPILLVGGLAFTVLWVLAWRVKARIDEADTLVEPDEAPKQNPVPFLLAWLLPGVAFFLLVYDGWPVRPSGYLAPLVAPFGLLVATFAVAWLRRAQDAPLARRRAAVAAMAVLALSPALGAFDVAHTVANVREVDAWWQGWREAPVEPGTAYVAFYAWPYLKLDRPDIKAYIAAPYPDGDTSHVLYLTTEGGEDSRPLYREMLDGAATRTHLLDRNTTRIIEVAGHPGGGRSMLELPDGQANVYQKPNVTDYRLPNGAVVPSVATKFEWAHAESYYYWTIPAQTETGSVAS